MELDFDKLFKITNTAMRLNRSDPNIPKNTKWVLQFVIMHGMFTVAFLILIFNIILNLKNKDFSTSCRNSTLAVVYVVITFFFCIMLWKMKQLKNIINTIKNDYDNIKKSSLEDQKIVLDYALKAVYVGKQWLVVISIGISAFILKNIFLYIYNYYTDTFRLIPFYEVVYPDFIEEKKDIIPVFIGIYLLLFYFAAYAGIMYITFVPLGPMFMLHACGKLEVLTSRVEKLFNGQKDVEIELKSIIVELQNIYNFVDEIKDAFRVAYELTLKATTLILPITIYEVLEAFRRGEISIEFLTFIFGGVLIGSSPCYYSELLMEKGEKFRLAVYSCGWESSFDRRTRKILALVLARAGRPIAIRTMFRTVCLDALADLFHQSYAIFNLMNAMWN